MVQFYLRAYLVDDGERHNEQCDEQVGDCQGHNEPVGWSAQFTDDADGRTDEGVADDCTDDDERTRQRQQRRRPDRVCQPRRRRHATAVRRVAAVAAAAAAAAYRRRHGDRTMTSRPAL